MEGSRTYFRLKGTTCPADRLLPLPADAGAPGAPSDLRSELRATIRDVRRWLLGLASLLLTVVIRVEPSLAAPGPGVSFDVTAPARTRQSDLLRVWRARLKGLGVSFVVHRVGAGKFSVCVRGVDETSVAVVTRAMARPGTLELHWVVHNTETARAWMRAFSPGRHEQIPDVVGEADSWMSSTGELMLDYHLLGADRGAILSALATQAPDWPVPPDLALLFEPFQAIGGKPQVRTYLVEPEPFLTRDAVTKVDLTRDPTTGALFVYVSFDPAGTARLQREAGAHAGTKLALVVDGVVSTAPVVDGATGRTSLWPSRGDAKENVIEAESLALSLRSDVLPAELDVRLAGSCRRRAAARPR